jgi:hypothetical protein
MKVFVRTTSLNTDDPEVVAVYGPTVEIASDAHGPGLTVVDIPPNFIDNKSTHGGVGIISMHRFKLKSGWRTGYQKETKLLRAGTLSSGSDDKVAALHELLGLVMEHGVNESQWPDDAKSRKADIDRSFNK